MERRGFLIVAALAGLAVLAALFFLRADRNRSTVELTPLQEQTSLAQGGESPSPEPPAAEPSPAPSAETPAQGAVMGLWAGNRGGSGSVEPPPASAGGRPVYGIVGPRSSGSSAAPPAPVAKRPEAVASSTLQEQAFLRANGQKLQAYHQKLKTIGEQGYKKYPVARQVDEAFARMPRYMQVRDEFIRTKDPFRFARESLALPEVRNEIKRRMAQPEAWAAALGMISEALKNPPPPEIYKAAQGFLSGDAAITGYMGEFVSEATRNVGALAKGIPAGMDLGALQKLAEDVAPGVVPPAATQAPRR